MRGLAVALFELALVAILLGASIGTIVLLRRLGAFRLPTATDERLVLKSSLVARILGLGFAGASLVAALRVLALVIEGDPGEFWRGVAGGGALLLVALLIFEAVNARIVLTPEGFRTSGIRSRLIPWRDVSMFNWRAVPRGGAFVVYWLKTDGARRTHWQMPYGAPAQQVAGILEEWRHRYG